MTAAGMTSFSDFLQRNSVIAADNLPLLHTTRSQHIKKIRGSDQIIASPCDVFISDNLNYFFVGRPAYKYTSSVSQAPYWELPACFIFSYDSIVDVKRIFPFDSGAFHNKRYPSYIGNMPLEDFEASAAPDAPSRIIGAYFGDARSYFELQPKGHEKFTSEFSLTAFDEEIKAAHRLATEGTPRAFDDRRFTIEVQSTANVDLSSNHPLAVIVPSEYFDNIEFREHVENVWKAVPISYPTLSLSLEHYYGIIYEKVLTFFRSRGIL